MPITLSKLANNTASVTLTYDEDSVTIVYYPARVTERTFAELQAFAGIDVATLADGFASLNNILSNLIKSWDVQNDDGGMYPTDPASLAVLPIAFRLQVLSAVMGDIRPEALMPQKTLN